MLINPESRRTLKYSILWGCIYVKYIVERLDLLVNNLIYSHMYYIYVYIPILGYPDIFSGVYPISFINTMHNHN